ncbi:ATP-Hypothetical protein cassette sub-family A ABC1 member [Nesidiocoris tenuis]|uniref:ABC transporter domain-containing protein n=1 Tax=Nesidiocoris tenuis TaxID=355587 RepID=A0ABN7B1K4_9HEMI|nr:ATP-Hypothetical protein cassette sub-family A ABC1 member [Nesidiocoris tenuis]
MATQGLAISITGAYKTYDGKKYILKGLNMNVKEGTIYGLLGPSGCGKSTILNAIVGLVGLEAGEINTLMETKKDLGFMPQQLALYDRMTTEETLAYFGHIYDMSEDEIEKRSALLIDFLEIPSSPSGTVALSGGQKRRLSLAAALIHNPPLVVLDEPTVGVDPVLRKSIWDYLITLAEREKKTIVITTHYIEETRQAHTIGLMRSGVLLCENSPESLLSQNDSRSLEDTFMRLSHLQECHKLKEEEEDERIRGMTLKKPKKPEYTKKESFFKRNRFKAEIQKNFAFIKRDFGLTLYTICVPLMSLICFNYGIGYDPRPFNMGVLNDEYPMGVGCQTWKPNDTCEFAGLSCRFLKKLEEKDVFAKNIGSMDEGLDLIRSSNILGVIHFPKNYSEALNTLVETQVLVEDPERDAAIEHGFVQIRMDQSNVVIFHILRQDLQDNLREMMGDLAEECGYHVKTAKLPPLKFEEPVYASLSTGIRDYMAPAFISILMFTMPMAYGVVIIMEERQSGATARSVAAGVTPFELMASHLMIQISIHFLQLLSSSLLMYVFLKYEFHNPYVGLGLLFTLGFPGIAMSFFIPLLMNSTLGASTICTGFVIANVLIGGTFWPVEGIHPIIKPVSWMLPTYFSTLALRNANFKGWGFTEPSIIFGFASIVAWTIIFVGAIYITIVVTKNRVFLGKNAP